MTPPAVRAPWENRRVASEAYPEEQFLELVDGPLVELRRALLDMGYSRALVDGCIGFVMGERTGQGVVTSPSRRSAYRKMLLAVGEAQATSPGLWAFVA